jgi:hypothetical protein
MDRCVDTAGCLCFLDLFEFEVQASKARLARLRRAQVCVGRWRGPSILDGAVDAVKFGGRGGRKPWAVGALCGVAFSDCLESVADHPQALVKVRFAAGLAVLEVA